MLNPSEDGRPRPPPTKTCCGVNCAHLKVLLKKDRLILARRRACCISLIVLPALFFFLSILQYLLTDHGLTDGRLFDSLFRYSTNQLTPPINGTRLPMPYLVNATGPDGPTTFSPRQAANAGLAQTCVYDTNDDKDHYEKIAVIAPDENVRVHAQKFFEDYVLHQSGLAAASDSLGLPQLQIDAFATREEFWQKLKGDARKHCVAVNFAEVNTETYTYKVEVSVPGANAPNTNKPTYNPLVRLPDETAWTTTLGGGSVALYPFINEFLARYQTGAPMDSPAPFLLQEVGFAPYRSPPVTELDQNTVNGFMNTIASCIMYAYITVFVYMANELASERESKSREGMKMMGLQDGTYYCGWFLLFTGFSVWSALTGTLIYCSTVFSNINGLFVFLFLVLYSFALFGQAWVIVAILPTPRGAILLVLLFQLLSFNLGQAFNNDVPAQAVVYALSLLPNIAMG